MKEVKRAYRLLHPKIAALLLVKRGEKTNVMTLAWHMPVDDEEKLIAISVCKENHSHGMLKSTREFTLNILSEKMVEKVWKAGTISGERMDKLKVLGMEVEKGINISTPHLKNCLGFLECKVVKEVDAGEHTLFIAKVLGAYANEKLFDKVWKKESKVLMHLGSNIFTTFSEIVKAED